MAEAGADLKSKMKVSLKKGVTVSSWGIFLGDKKLVPESPSRLSLTCLWLELGLSLIAELIRSKENGWALPEAPGYMEDKSIPVRNWGSIWKEMNAGQAANHVL